MPANNSNKSKAASTTSKDKPAAGKATAGKAAVGKAAVSKAATGKTATTKTQKVNKDVENNVEENKQETKDSTKSKNTGSDKEASNSPAKNKKASVKSGENKEDDGNKEKAPKPDSPNKATSDANLNFNVLDWKRWIKDTLEATNRERPKFAFGHTALAAAVESMMLMIVNSASVGLQKDKVGLYEIGAASIAVAIQRDPNLNKMFYQQLNNFSDKMNYLNNINHLKKKENLAKFLLKKSSSLNLTSDGHNMLCYLISDFATKLVDYSITLIEYADKKSLKPKTIKCAVNLLCPYLVTDQIVKDIDNACPNSDEHYEKEGEEDGEEGDDAAEKKTTEKKTAEKKGNAKKPAGKKATTKKANETVENADDKEKEEEQQEGEKQEGEEQDAEEQEGEEQEEQENEEGEEQEDAGNVSDPEEHDNNSNKNKKPKTSTSSSRKNTR
ncbi:hypothetical protein Catovirus_1_933 [Catovirus CTV1]|uniref:Uncharacterized protein n=1 Tax=Catovirus CTV1 TaxID=1977631 RepID=A0A1V0SB03_9VIRU|nr:hypothetical protein Catovirus_1_933 [Catovirus CTV1]